MNILLTMNDTDKNVAIAEYFEANKHLPIEEVRQALDELNSKHAEV